MMRRILVGTLASLTFVSSPRAQTVTAADYARAARFLAPGVNALVVGGVVVPNWLPDGRFWYRNTTLGGPEIVVIDPVKRSRERCDAGATTCAGATISVPASGGGGRRGFGGGGGPVSSTGQPLALSPDGRKGAFVKDWNLWVRDMTSGQERALTTDGTKWFGYAIDNAGWSTSDRAMVAWSPDSRKIATQQQDERSVGEMYLVSTVVGHPSLRVSKFPLPGDSVMAMLHRVVIDVDAGTVTRLRMPPDYHRGTIGDDIRMGDYVWSPDARRLAIASVARDHKRAWLSIADVATGDARKVYEETVPTQYESRAQWQVLWPTNEFVWYSEKDGWGQLYLHDLATGALKKQITTGEGPVMSVARLDEKGRAIWFGANGREPGQDPYFNHLYRISLEGGRQTSLTPEDGNHTTTFSPDGKWIVDTYSTPVVPPTVVLRDGATGRVVMPLEKADISRLLATGWKPPMPITVKARDGKTDLYGLMFVPTQLDSTRKYPIVNNVYPGPQTGSTGSRSFAAARGDRQALAELGFVVVTIDGMGTPGRSKAFQDAYYGAMGRDNTIPDQISGMTDLARRYRFIDLDRAGIWGHSGGGFATTTAMFRFPGVFKVGIAESGNHDQRVNEDDWGERYQGLVVRDATGTDSYAAEANQEFAKNLVGHLLLAHGTMDTNVPPYQTMLVADALIKANKDFDLLMIPNANHGYGAASNYMMRRRWDYFVKWLMGSEPPKEFDLGTATR
ncbi:peptidase S9B dipeptidylpeptidase IV domain protein (plasmid) [Gemmatirosa kalamazoonensis]|uniref:Peptidase S9B dipeptidylpeptidase IV domain protein n=1 Tax=Gemmatirosa kalamazoonensis TaxID=861299 RepID=W0RMX9_9BACT|nr:DPP IV N-terminal domain-containing protein [Gemmatirosa kalamazoonensis]AHG92394.1 peptidase S9B dipeptidylpeptidase IV domain protein [Gemmatirosa kalamazoonensis]